MNVAIVTGAARGIGAATVHALVAQGWSVRRRRLRRRRSCAAVPARDPRPISRPSPVRRCIPFVADVRDEAALGAAVAEAETRFGGLDAAIAAAGVIAGGVPQWELPAAAQQAVLDVNLGGVLEPGARRDPGAAAPSRTAQRTVPRRRLGGRDAGPADARRLLRGEGRRDRPRPRARGRTRRHRRHGERRQPGLDRDRACSTRPRGCTGSRPRQDFAAQQPLGRLLEPAEIAAVLAFLAGAGRRAITGAVVPVDGGLAV